MVDLDDTPQQNNGSDCGVYVCLNMRHLLEKKLLRSRTGEKVNMSLGGKLVDAREGRKEILRVIEDYKKEIKHIRSRS